MPPDDQQAVYTLSGLGADQRLFGRLRLPPGFAHRPLPWLIPHASESIGQYARRLASDVRDTRPILLGVSFGGIVAQELAAHVNPALVILISSIESRRELPWYYRAASRLRLHTLMGKGKSRAARRIVHFMNGVQSEDAKRVLDDMLADIDSQFTRWAIDRLLHWSGCKAHYPIVHLHGTADRLLPYRYVSADEALTDGHHFMVYENADWVNRTIETHLLDMQKFPRPGNRGFGEGMSPD